ncbi:MULTISPECIES: GNAT family protein [unclassified Methylobacterium]|uniref:GNAT family N-acetyltransferase n=1 Tax=unclassified Methylobacterium TaxID=2615210 RepID=UPI0006FDA9B1|nr:MULTISPECIES: GNAT family protein [unclassified Methylobacterium]KQO48880.1 GNAT family acetyltransferase [Methylobacterium sp. Leaf86]KQO93432.1 GNAT family acetyltransferase [Methylobacterium sp. Leaf91]
MSERVNRYGQPIGPALPEWSPPPPPPREALQGRFCRIEPLDAERHAGDLFTALAHDPARWTYLPGEPPADEAEYRARLVEIARSRDPMHHAILDAATGRALGLAAYLRIEPAHGCIEVGHLQFGPGLARSPAATEAMALMMARAFDLGYRRYEWKCDSLNAPSRAAALRYGFTFEGIFRNAIVTKGRSRDTAWFAVTDADWPRLREAFAAWLAPENFDDAGRQRRSLAALRG